MFSGHNSAGLSWARTALKLEANEVAFPKASCHAGFLLTATRKPTLQQSQACEWKSEATYNWVSFLPVFEFWIPYWIWAPGALTS